MNGSFRGLCVSDGITVQPWPEWPNMGTASPSTQAICCRKIQALMLNKSYSLQPLSPFLAWLSVKTRPHRRYTKTHQSSHKYFLPSVPQPNLHPNSTCPGPGNTLLLAAVYAVEVPIKCLLKITMQLQALKAHQRPDHLTSSPVILSWSKIFGHFLQMRVTLKSLDLGKLDSGAYGLFEVIRISAE